MQEAINTESVLRSFCLLNSKEQVTRNKLADSLRSPRCLRMIENKTKLIESRVSARLCEKVFISSLKVLKKLDKRVLELKKSGCLAIQLKAYKGRAVVIIDPKLVKLIAKEIFLVEKEDFNSSLIMEEELAAISFIFAEILSEEDCFGNHRGYLSGIKLYPTKSSTVDVSSFFEEIENLMRKGKSSGISFNIDILNYRFNGAVIFCSNLIDRIEKYGRFEPLGEKEKKILKAVDVFWRLRLQTIKKTIKEVSNLKVGDIFKITKDLEEIEAVLEVNKKSKSLFEKDLKGKVSYISTKGNIKIKF